MTSTILAEIANNWRLEAKEEDNGRYFYISNDIPKILSGQKTYIIGRKGMGKTAISEYVSNLDSVDTFTEKLNFKNFPFNELYKQSNSDYTPPNQYITLWKHVIYSVICKMMLRNKNINSEVQESLGLSYEPDKISSLPRLIAKWTDADFDVLDIEESSKNFKRNSDIPWITKVDILEDIIKKHLDESKYYIIFDELDEDYRNIKETESFTHYLNLITSLFKAVQDIRSVFKGLRKQIFPIIFLRDDIYSMIKDADKNKWGDFKIDIDWDEEKIKRLIAFRISKAISAESPILPFGKAWGMVFENAQVQMGNRQANRMDSFDYITRSTQLRPRDYIRYIQVCADATYNNGGSIISADTVKKVDKAFSNYLKNEIEDELFPILPDISNIYRIFSEIQKQTFGIDEFKVTTQA